MPPSRKLETSDRIAPYRRLGEPRCGVGNGKYNSQKAEGLQLKTIKGFVVSN